MAATNKCLAQSNKSRTGVPATNKRPAARRIPLALSTGETPLRGLRCRLQRFRGPQREANTMQGLQGNLPTFFVVIIATAAFLAGLCGERLRAKLARQAWQKRRWRVPFKAGVAPVTDPAEQLRLVMGARFEKRRLLSRSEARVLYAVEREINTAGLKWRVMAQVSLGEVLSSPRCAGL
jgi:hypothetical protein